MTRTTRLGLATLTLCLVAGQANADLTIAVTPASAPNAYGGAGYPGWEANAIYAIERGLASWGTPGTPAYYTQAPTTMAVRQNMTTSYPSWQGYANPTGAYSAEYGNRVQFGVHIVGGGTRFSISQLSFVMASGDGAYNSLGWTNAEGSYNYNAGYVGIDYGADGIKSGDDIYITSGLNTQLVDELVGRGSGNAWWPAGDELDPSNPILGRQGAIEDAAGFLNALGPFNFTGTYSLGGVVSGGQVTFVPTPGAAALLGLGGLIVSRRRR